MGREEEVYVKGRDKGRNKARGWNRAKGRGTKPGEGTGPRGASVTKPGEGTGPRGEEQGKGERNRAKGRKKSFVLYLNLNSP